MRDDVSSGFLYCQALTASNRAILRLVRSGGEDVGGEVFCLEIRRFRRGGVRRGGLNQGARGQRC